MNRKANAEEENNDVRRNYGSLSKFAGRIAWSGIGFIVMLGMQTSVLAQTLQFTPVAGKDSVDVKVTGLAQDAEAYCRIGGSKTGKSVAVKANASGFPITCPNKFQSDEWVTVWMIGKDKSQIARNRSQVKRPVAGDSTMANEWDLSVSAKAGDKFVTVTVVGANPGVTGTDFAVQTGANLADAKDPANSVTITSGGAFQIPVKTALTLGDAIRVVARSVSSDSYVAAASASGLKAEFTPNPKDAGTTISGNLSGDTAALSQVQAVFVEVLNGTDVAQGPLDGAYDTAKHTFSPTGVKALSEGQTVHVHVCGTPGSTTFRGALSKSSVFLDVSTEDDAAKLALMKPGVALSGGTIAANTTIVAFDPVTKRITMSNAATDDLAAASPAATKLQITMSGQSCVQFGASGKTLIELEAQNTAVIVDSPYDLGRLKSYFSVGAEVHGSNGSLGTTTDFFGLNIDENLFRFGPTMHTPCFSRGDSELFMNANGDGNSKCNEHQRRFLVNSYLEFELNQITTPSSGSSLSLSSAKGAYIEGGVYAPFMPASMQWTFRGQENSFFVAPIGRYIFLDPNNPAASGSSTPPPGTYNIYRAYGGGLRLGHFRLPANFGARAPDLLSYLDVTAGKWENYRESSGKRGMRVDIDGRYKIPYTPLFVGFDANTGPGGSDFRLYAGARIDVSSLLGKLIPGVQ